MRGKSLVSVTAYHSFGGEVGVRTKPHDTLPYLFMPSPTFAHPLASPDAIDLVHDATSSICSITSILRSSGMMSRFRLYEGRRDFQSRLPASPTYYQRDPAQTTTPASDGGDLPDHARV
jgi:hypothetical protein